MKRQWVIGGCVLAMLAAPEFMKTIALVLLLTVTVCNNGCLGFLAAILGAVVNVVGGVVSAIGPLLGAGMSLASSIVGAVAGKETNTTTANEQGVTSASTVTQAERVQNETPAAQAPEILVPDTVPTATK